MMAKIPAEGLFDDDLANHKRLTLPRAGHDNQYMVITYSPLPDPGVTDATSSSGDDIDVRSKKGSLTFVV
jgi:hypothetical protein